MTISILFYILLIYLIGGIVSVITHEALLKYNTKYKTTLDGLITDMISQAQYSHYTREDVYLKLDNETVYLSWLGFLVVVLIYLCAKILN